MSINKVFLMGNLSSHPEIKDTSTGKTVCNFNLATNESWTDQSGKKIEKATFHRIQVWGKSANNCSTFLKKGSKVFLEGKISNRSYDQNGVKKYITEIIASSVQFLDPREKSGQDRSNAQKTPVYTADTIPF